MKRTNLLREVRTLALDHDLTLQSRVQSVFPTLSAEIVSSDEAFLAPLEVSLRKQLRSWILKQATETRDELLATFSALEADLFERITDWTTQSLGNPKFKPRDLEAEWTALLAELRGLEAMSDDLTTVWILASEIEDCGAAAWAELLRTQPSTPKEDSLLPANWRDAWMWRLQKSYLLSIDGRAKILALTKMRHQTETKLRNAYEDVIEKRTWLRLVKQLRLDTAITRAITAYVQAIKGMTKSGKGKRDPKLRQAAREAMHLASGGVPCWIMPQWRVSESLPATLGTFDLVIIDEASQSDAWAIPALLRGKKVLIVGDDKQVGPQPSFTRQEQIDQIQDRLRVADVPSDIRNRLDPKESIYDLGELVFAGQTIRLREHFRCAAPIIEFSNRLCYNGEIQCVRVPDANERLLPCLVDVHVRTGIRETKWKINKPEAMAIVEEISQLVADPSFGSRSIGVVSLLGPDQARYIFDQILEKIGEESFLKHNIRCGDARTFQGSEADVIFISAVDDSSSGGVMTMNLLDNIRRINVAVSRARDRCYFYHSFAREDLSELDLRAKLIDHFKAPLTGITDEAGRELCESSFEEEMFDALCDRGYRIIPQVRVGSYRIDMVVEGNHGKRLAVECDGDSYHGPEKWMEDMSRQRVLERAGWKFWRCWGSSFARDREDCLADLVSVLEEEGIDPIGSADQDFSQIVEFRTIEPEGEDLDEEVDQILAEMREPSAEGSSTVPLEEPPSEEDTPPPGRRGREDPRRNLRRKIPEAPPKDKNSPTLAELIKSNIDFDEQPQTPPPPQPKRPSRSPGLFDNEVSDLLLFKEQPSEPTSSHSDPEDNSPRLSAGDLVRYCFLDDEEEEITVSIEDQPSNPDLGVINIETPIAEGLLGNRVGSICEVQLPQGTREVRILSIENRH